MPLKGGYRCAAPVYGVFRSRLPVVWVWNFSLSLTSPAYGSVLYANEQINIFVLWYKWEENKSFDRKIFARVMGRQIHKKILAARRLGPDF